MVKQEISKLIKESIKKLQKDRKIRKFKLPEILVERPREKSYGDYSTNLALQIAKIIKKEPMETANLIVNSLDNKIVSSFFSKVEIVKPGFINFFISEGYLQNQIKEILEKRDRFGDLEIGKNQKINVEFISANPTGPLTLGNGRGGFWGDVLSNVLEKAGYQVEREYYINDFGEQIRKLGRWEYKGDYIKNLKIRIGGEEKDPDKVGQKAAQIILKEMIKPTVKKMGIKFDTWFSERSLYRRKEVEKVIDFLKERKLTYKKEGALWFKSTKFGDDKDRVLVRADGRKTYFASDIAYLKNKFERGFDKLIFFWGADHYGYINRTRAAVQALGYKKEQIDFIIMQMVRLIKKGKEVKMSKRAGTYLTLDELIDEVGLDVSRFFFLMRGPDTHLDFDLDLAKEQSKKNPVYYVQYAYARIHSILVKSKSKNQKTKLQIKNQNLLKEPAELNLIKQLFRLPEIIQDTAKDYQLQRFPQYALDLADDFHRFYETCRVISKDKELTQARLSLILATKIVLKNVLDLMGISAPRKM